MTLPIIHALTLLHGEPRRNLSEVLAEFSDNRWDELEAMLEEGIMFDGSSIAGWKSINESDMFLVPDISTAVMDPFTAQPQLILFCNVHEPSTGQPYNRDPRSVANSALAYMQSIGIADTAYFGPEAEFFVFDDVRCGASVDF